MGLYLCVFASASGDVELEGVEVGSYDDFHVLRTTVAERLEGGRWGSRFPVLMSHTDSDGEWTCDEARQLVHELRTIEAEMAPESPGRCFIDVDGEPLFERLRELAELAVEHERPISFQ